MTIVGVPRGVGKTRLACELAEGLTELYPGGCYLVDLSDQDTRDGIAIELADALGERLATKGDPGEVIAVRLEHRKPTLFVLDNFEQLIAHAESTVGLWHRASPEVVGSSRAGQCWVSTTRSATRSGRCLCRSRERPCRI